MRRDFPSKKAKKSLIFSLATFMALALSACASYYLPATHLDTPEVRGLDPARPWGGRMELAAIQSGTDLSALPSFYYPKPATTDAPQPDPRPKAATSFANYSFGYVMPLDDKMEVGVRMQPMAPLLFRFKYQFEGQPEIRSARKMWSVSAAVSPGILLAPGVTYFSGDLSVPVGYRAWEKHLFSVWPFFSFASLSGTPIPASKAQVGVTTLPVSAVTDKASASASQYGAALGYQYSLVNFFLRMEAVYLLGGSLGGSEIGGICFGALVGLTL